MRTALRRLTSLAAVGALAAAGLVLTAGVAHAEPVAYAIAGNPHPEDRDVCQFGTVDLAAGDFAPVGAPSEDLCVFDLTVAPDGTVYGIQLAVGDVINPWLLQTIDPATGAVTASAAIGPGGSNDGGEGGGVAYTAGGQLYAEYVPQTAPSLDPCIGGGAYCLATLDAANPGTTDIIGPGPDVTQIESLSISCAGDFVVSQGEVDPNELSDATEWPDSNAEVLLDADLASVSPTDGSTDVVGPYGQVVTGHDFDDAGTLWGVGFIVGGPPSVFTIDTATGEATPTATISENAGLFAIAIPHCVPPMPVPTPEPVVVQPTFTG